MFLEQTLYKSSAIESESFMNIKHKTLQFKKKKISGYCCKKKKVPEIKEKKRTAKTNRAERISKNEA